MKIDIKEFKRRVLLTIDRYENIVLIKNHLMDEKEWWDDFDDCIREIGLEQ